jgi:hypothetical protein
MKNIRTKYILASAAVIAITIVACGKNFLDKPPLGTLNPAIVANEPGVQGILIGAYALLDGAGAAGDDQTSGSSNWVYGGVASDDAYKGSDPSDFNVIASVEDWTVTPSTGLTGPKWNLLYAGVQRSNDVLRTLAIATGVSEDAQKQITAQARFLRAYYHFELRRIFGKVIYADESVNNDSIDVDNSTEIYPKIEDDLKAAIDGLPESWGAEVGRANVWAAKALLAKVYMAQNKYSDAYPILKDIIANGKNSAGVSYALMPNYYSNFNPQQKNNSETVFSAQTSVQDGSAVDWGADPNGNYGDMLNFPYTGGPGACCGFYNPSQDLGNAYKTDADGLPLLDTWYQGNSVSNATTPYTGTLDPRIDLVMGRPGVPYLDWGPVPTDNSWIRNPINDGRFLPKKNVYAASQKGGYVDNSGYWGPNELVANNVNLIRFSDVILWAAECAANNNEYSAATDYVNQIRERASHTSSWVYLNSDYDAATATYAKQTTPAGNYKIGLYKNFTSKDNALKAIQFERRLELAMEGHRFFDLVRWGTADQVLNSYYAREKAIRPLKANAKWTPGKNEVFPIPQSQIDQMNSDGVVRLTQNPNY